MANNSLKHNPFTRIIFKPIRNIVRLINPTLYVKWEYRYITGHKLNINKPEKYTEKLQYLRLFVYPNDDLVSTCASRIGLREYVKNSKIKVNLIDVLGIYNSFDEIDFDKLPNQFVIKCNHASGFNEIVYDKSSVERATLKAKFNKWMSIDYGKKTVESHYSKCERKIIIEKLLLENNTLPIEYKIHVFNGIAKYMYIVTNRNKDIRYNNFLIDWSTFDEAQFNHWQKTNEKIKKPNNWDEMVKIAEQLAKPFPFVRIDLYYVNEKIYISEMTFTPAKGTLIFKGGENVDYLIGKWLNLPNEN